MDTKPSYTKPIALSGILLALNVIILYIASIFPTGRIGMYVLTSFLVAVVVFEAGPAAGWVFYLATCLLTFLLLANKTGILVFASFFGVYALIKYYIEKIDSIIPVYTVKIIYFNIFTAAILYFFRNFFNLSFIDEFPRILIHAAATVVFVGYDVVFTLFIRYYNNKIRKVLRM